MDRPTISAKEKRLCTTFSYIISFRRRCKKMYAQCTKKTCTKRSEDQDRSEDTYKNDVLILVHFISRKMMYEDLTTMDDEVQRIWPHVRKMYQMPTSQIFISHAIRKTVKMYDDVPSTEDHGKRHCQFTT